MTKLSAHYSRFVPVWPELPPVLQTFLELGLVMLFSFLLTSIIAEIARRKLARGRELPWYDRARILYPWRSLLGSVTAVLLVSTFMVSNLLYHGFAPLPSALETNLFAISAYLGALFPAYRFSRATFTHTIDRKTFFLGNLATLTHFIIICLIMSQFYTLLAEFEWGALYATILAFVLFVVLTKLGSTLFVFKLYGLILPPSERLRSIVKPLAQEFSLSEKLKVFEMRSPIANAFALPSRSIVAATSRAMEILSDQELEQIMRHELAHLTENRIAQLTRFIPLFLYMSFLGLWPLLATFENASLYFFPALVLAILLTRCLSALISQRLENRADNGTKTEDPARYASALEKLYQDNLFPAHVGKSFATHPSLYDRMLASGVTPGFERPAKPNSFIYIFGLLGAIVLLFLFQSTLVMANRRSIEQRYTACADPLENGAAAETQRRHRRGSRATK